MSLDTRWLLKDVQQQNKRSAILAAAAQLFNEKDFHTVTVEEIAKTAGIGKGTIYQYFAGKESILEELRAWMTNIYVEDLKRLDVQGKTFGEAIDLILTWHLNNLSIPLGIGKQMLNCPIGVSMKETISQYGILIETLNGKLEEIWTQAVANNEVRQCDKDVAFGAIASNTVGLCMYLFVCQEDDSLQKKENMLKKKDEMLSYILHGLAKGDL